MSLLSLRLATAESVLDDLESKVTYAAEKATEAIEQKAALEAKIEADKKAIKVTLVRRYAAVLTAS